MTPLDRDLEHTAAALQPNLPEVVGVLVVHRIEDDDTAVCGATVGPEDMEHPDWTDLRSEVTCQACLDRMDEADFDRAHP